MSKTNTPWKGFIITGALLLSTLGGSAWGGTRIRLHCGHAVLGISLLMAKVS